MKSATNNHGGKRQGAGRSKNTFKYGEKTVVMRVPTSLASNIRNFSQTRSFSLPIFSTKVSAGYPLPCDDSIPEQLDLNEYLVHHPSATFIVRATGDSMIGAGIFDNDILIVDRSLEARHNSIVVAAVDGYLTVKRLWRRDGKCLLIPENTKYKPIDISENCETIIWGVVAHVIHSVL